MPRKPPPPPPKQRRAPGTGQVKQDRKTGRWKGQVKIKGAWRYFGATTEQGVEDKIAAALAEAAAGLDHAHAGMTVGQYLARWLMDLPPELAFNTRRAYEWATNGYLIPMLGHIPLAALKGAHVEDMLRAVRRRDIPLSQASAASLRRVLSNALSEAERRELVAHNIARRMKVRRQPEPEIEPLTVEEARRFLAAIRGDRFEALYAVVMAVGLRRGEALGLRWRDVDLAAGVLRVRVQLQYERSVPVLKPAPKTATGRRVVHLPPFAVAALAAHRVRQEAERAAYVPGAARLAKWRRDRSAPGLGWEWGLVFTTPTGQPVGLSALRLWFGRLLADAGLPEQHFHHTRHFAASLLIAQGVPERVAMDVLGHATATMTRHYAHVSETSRAAAAAAIQSALSPPGGDGKPGRRSGIRRVNRRNG